MKKKLRKIAYGTSDFERIQNRNNYYVDKTHFIPQLEENDYVFFIRPRRFGKSLWVSILETYYDQAKKDRFEQLFKGTWIEENPTEEQGIYLVLTFNFSMIRAEPDHVEQSFEEHGRINIHSFLRKYEDLFPKERVDEIQQEQSVSAKLTLLFKVVSELELSLYILIDEYDNFANTILSTVGKTAYHKLTHGDGFYRHFFAVLKGGTGNSGAGLKRLFITGVSPITMDDVTSGFNIGSNLSFDPRFNEITGFTEVEVRAMLSYYQEEGGGISDLEKSVELMRLWYGHYRFGEETTVEMFNTDMVLYFVQKSIQTQSLPKQLIDQNIRIDYGKLRHLLLVNKQLNGNFNCLKSIVEERKVISPIRDSFPLEQLTQTENFISLLYYFGLLSVAGTEMGEPQLVIPNQTVSELLYGYLREAWRDTEIFQLDFLELGKRAREMAWLGRWREFFSFIAGAIQEQTGIRDYLSQEKVVQGFLLAYLNISDFYISQTEKEMNKGYADIFLEPFLAKYPELPIAYLIELKYIKRSDFSEVLLQEKVAEAQQQLMQYRQDGIVTKQYASVETIALILVFNGWELVYCEACD